MFGELDTRFDEEGRALEETVESESRKLMRKVNTESIFTV